MQQPLEASSASVPATACAGDAILVTPFKKRKSGDALDTPAKVTTCAVGRASAQIDKAEVASASPTLNAAACGRAADNAAVEETEDAAPGYAGASMRSNSCANINAQEPASDDASSRALAELLCLNQVDYRKEARRLGVALKDEGCILALAAQRAEVKQEARSSRSAGDDGQSHLRLLLLVGMLWTMQPWLRWKI